MEVELDVDGVGAPLLLRRVSEVLEWVAFVMVMVVVEGRCSAVFILFFIAAV